jgi:hypothetical protein
MPQIIKSFFAKQNRLVQKKVHSRWFRLLVVKREEEMTASSVSKTFARYATNHQIIFC